MSTLLTVAQVATPVVTAVGLGGLAAMLRRAPVVARDAAVVVKDAGPVVKAVEHIPGVEEALGRLDKATAGIGRIVVDEVAKQLPSALRAAVLAAPASPAVKPAEPAQPSPLVVVEAAAAKPASEPTAPVAAVRVDTPPVAG